MAWARRLTDSDEVLVARMASGRQVAADTHEHGPRVRRECGHTACQARHGDDGRIRTELEVAHGGRRTDDALGARSDQEIVRGLRAEDAGRDRLKRKQAGKRERRRGDPSASRESCAIVS